MAPKTIPADRYNRALFELGSITEHDYNKRSKEHAAILKKHAIESDRELPYFPMFVYGNDEMTSYGISNLAADPTAREKAVHWGLTDRVGKAQLHENLDTLLAIAGTPRDSKWALGNDELVALTREFETLATWRQKAERPSAAKQENGLNKRETLLVQEAFSKMAAQALEAMAANDKAEPSVFDAWPAFQVAIKAEAITEEKLHAAALANLGARLDAIAGKERTALNDAPIFHHALSAGVVGLDHASMNRFEAALLKETRKLDAKAWAALPANVRASAEQLVGPPPGVNCGPAQSHADLGRMLRHLAHGNITLEQLRPTIAAFAEDVKGRGYAKAAREGVKPEELGQALLDLGAAVETAKKLGIALPAQGVEAAKDGLLKGWLTAVNKGQAPLTGVFELVDTLIAKHEFPAAETTSALYASLADGLRRNTFGDDFAYKLMLASTEKGADKSRAAALAQAMFEDVRASGKEPVRHYYDFDLGKNYQAIPKKLKSLIPEGIWKPMIAAFGEKHAPNSEEGAKISAALVSMQKANWIPKEAVQAYLRDNDVAGGALERLEKIFKSDKHVMVESKEDLIGFGRDGDTYYIRGTDKEGTTLLRVKKGEDAEKVDSTKNFEARAIRVAGDNLIVLSELNGAGWIAVYDKNTDERLRRRALPRPVNHAADCSAALTPDGSVLFPESKHGRSDYIVAFSSEFDAKNVKYVRAGGDDAVDGDKKPLGFKAEAVAVRGDHAYGAFFHRAKGQLQIMRYGLPKLDKGKQMLDAPIRIDGSPQTMWFTGYRLFVNDGTGLRAFEIDGEKLNPVGMLPYPFIRDVVPREDGGADVLMRNDAFGGKAAGTRIVRLNKQEVEAIFAAPLGK